MARLVEGRLVIATHNPGKLLEMRELLEPYGIEAVSAAELGLVEPEETGKTFIANALIKAEAATDATGLPAFADDSGLCVDALGGEPGIVSARWAKEAGSFELAMDGIARRLAEVGAKPPFAAHFVSALALSRQGEDTRTFEGTIQGQLVFPPRGTLGFGYDPMFLPNGLERTFGEIASSAKHGIPADGSRALSHRARAFQDFAAACLRCAQKKRLLILRCNKSPDNLCRRTEKPMSATWNTKYGSRRVRHDPPTLPEAIAAAQGLTDDPNGQMEIAAGLMNVPVADVKAEMQKMAPDRRVTRIVSAPSRDKSVRTVVVERKTSRRIIARPSGV